MSYIPLLLGGLLIFTALFSGCTMFLQEPSVSVEEVALDSLSLSEIRLNVTLTVDNPMPTAVHLQTVSYDIFYQDGNEWVFLAHGSKEGLTAQPGNNTVSIPVSLKNASLLQAMIRALTHKEITLRISGVASPKVFFFTGSVPFSKVLTIPLSGRI